MQKLSETIEHLSQEISRKEKIYALALKIGTSRDVLKEMQSDLEQLRIQLKNLRDSNGR
jgi:chromosome segregation ATPase